MYIINASQINIQFIENKTTVLKFKININRQNETTQSAVKWHESTGGRTDGWAHGPQQQPTEVYSQTKRAQRLDVSATDQRLAVMCVTIGLSQQHVPDCLLITPTRRSFGAYTYYTPSQQLRSNAVRAIHARTTDRRHTRSHHRDHRRTHTATFCKFANRNTHSLWRRIHHGSYPSGTLII